MKVKISLENLRPKTPMGSGALCLAFTVFLALFRVSAPPSEPCEPTSHRELKVSLIPWIGFVGGPLSGDLMKHHVSQSRWKHPFGISFIFDNRSDSLNSREDAISCKDKEAGVDVLWATLESWPAESKHLQSKGINAQAFMKVAHSSESCGILTDKAKIKSIQQLRDNELAAAAFTPAHWLAIQNAPSSGTIRTVESPEEARRLFLDHDVPAVALCEPLLHRAKKPWAQEFGQQSEITYILVARQTLLEDDAARESISDLARQWLAGNDDASTTHRDAAKHIIAEHRLIYDEADEESERDEHYHNDVSLGTVTLATKAENILFFGADGGPLIFDDHFDHVRATWSNYGVATSEANKVRNKQIITSIKTYVSAVRELCDSTTPPSGGLNTTVSFLSQQFEIDAESAEYLKHIASVVNNNDQAQVCITDIFDDRESSRQRRSQGFSAESNSVRAYLRGVGVGFDRVIVTEPNTSIHASVSAAKTHQVEVRTVIGGSSVAF